MLSQQLQDAMNAQINAEYWSAYLYLSMSLDAQSKGLNGIANWFFVQWQEEQDHARILEQYMLMQDAKVELHSIAPVQKAWESPKAMFKDTLKHEKEVTTMIVNMMHIARKDDDFASMNRLQWFIDEQVEEELNARDMLSRISLFGEEEIALYILDRDLGTRKYTQIGELGK